MPPLNAFIHNAIAQLFDEIESKCNVKFATFTASEKQGQKNIAAGQRDYMDDTPNNSSHGIYKYLYDPELRFDYRFHQRLAAAPFQKTSKPWATIMFNTKQVRPLTDVLSHVYTGIVYNDDTPYQMTYRRVSVPVNMVIISNDMTKLYNTTEKIAMYFDRFINFHYDQVLTFGNPCNTGFELIDNVAGQAKDIREIDLDKLDTEHRGSLCTQAYSFDLIYWIAKTPNVSLKLLKKIILDIDYNKDGKIDDTWIIQ